ncbi:hybrid sensor histidine kinase/response regulator [Reinekea blandensis]|uniref:histidine kinase n=1 Tax=Reinekea blandensis MED297 TaxID=314283 RepID=A4BB38_9GAMM|nr:hybrid sensor histidine kinase/response regulator [Reinekea blandensis]EAR10651.1 GAF sensor hybrid histidine kinase [Reinekea sp. MED297] [Reinekea blandensis MED297]
MTLIELDRESPHARNIQWERQSLFVDEVQPRMVASGLGAALLALLMMSNLSIAILLTWLVICLSVSVGSYFLLTRQRQVLGRDYQQDRSYRLGYWHRINLLIALTWGALWSVLPWFFLDGASQSQIFTLLLFVMVMSSMPSVTMGTYPDIYLLFIVPVFSSLFILLWPTSTPLLLIVVALSGVSLAVFSLMTHKSQMNSIRLRLEHQLAQQQAHEADQAKSRFLAAASHDLRQPLQAANLYLQTLSSRAESQDELLLKAKHSVESANELLTKLLDMSLLDANVVTVSIQPCQLQSMLDAIESEFAEQAMSKGLKLRIAPMPVEVSTDPVLLMQILRNLIGNAVKYTRAGSVDVSVELRETQATLRIEDTGPGIPADEQSHVFKEFYRAAHGQSSEPGMGLGLSIVKRLCDQLNVPLTLVSEPGHGTTFSLTLPVSRQTSGVAGTERRSPSLPESFVAIVVDDNPDVLEALSMMLVEWNGDVWTAASFAELQALLQTLPSAPDVLLTDDMLDDEHRSEDCIAEVQQRYPNTPCAVITGNTSLRGIQRLSHTQWPVLHKPVDSALLKETLANLINSRQSSQ